MPKRKSIKALTVAQLNSGGLDWVDEWIRNYAHCEDGSEKITALNQIAPYLFAKRAPIQEDGTAAPKVTVVIVGDDGAKPALEDQS